MNNDLPLFCKALNQIRRNMINEIKTAKISVEKGDPVTRTLGHLTGGVYNTIGLSPALTRDLSPYREGDIEHVRNLAEALEEEYPQELGDVSVIQGGGLRPLDTLKRHFTNKRTGIVGKTLGLPITAGSALLSSVARQPVYSPYTDEIYDPWDNTGIAAHEFGHALDYNSNPIKEDDSFLKQKWKKLKRDLYPFARRIPGGSMYQEIKAWKKAEEAINKILKKHKLKENEEDRLVDSAAQAEVPALTSYGVDEIKRLGFPTGVRGTLITPLTGLVQMDKENIKQKLLKGVPARKTDKKEKPQVKNKENENKKKENTPASKAAAFNANLRMLQAANSCKTAFMDALGRLGDQMTWGLPVISGAAIGERLLENAKDRRIRNAAQYRNEAYRRLQHDEALGTVSGVPYNEAIEDVERETAKRKKTRVIDYYLPALATAGGLGLGYSAYKNSTKSKSASVTDKATTIKTAAFNTNLSKLQILNAKYCR